MFYVLFYRSEGFPLAAYSIPGRNGTWAWTPGKILLGAPSPPSSPSPFGWLVGGPKLYRKIDTNPHNMDVYAYFMH